MLQPEVRDNLCGKEIPLETIDPLWTLRCKMPPNLVGRHLSRLLSLENPKPELFLSKLPGCPSPKPIPLCPEEKGE